MQIDGVKIEEVCDFLDSNINLESLSIDKKNVEIFFYNKSNFSKISNVYKKIKINGAILVKNQENMIINSINSIKQICNDIYIFDTGSTDKTIDNIQNLNMENVHINQINWIEDYSYMRNYVNNHTPDSWLLIIDSDEELILFDESKLKLLKIELAFLTVFFNNSDLAIRFRQVFNESTEVNWPTRLYRKSKFVSFFGYVHEELKSEREIIYIPSSMTVLNNGSLPEEMVKFDKESRYFKLLLKNIELEPENLQWYSLLPFDKMMNEEKIWYMEKMKFFSQKIFQEKINSSFNERLLTNYAKALIKNYDFDRANNLLRKTVDMYPENPNFIFLKYVNQLNIVENHLLKMISNLKSDIQKLYTARENKSKWLAYNNLNLLTIVMVKILFKAEFYDLSYETFDESLLNENDCNLILAEIELLKKKKEILEV